MTSREALIAYVKAGRIYTMNELLSFLEANAPRRTNDDSRRLLITNLTTNARRGRHRSQTYEKMGYNILFKIGDTYRRYVTGKDPDPIVP